jgi:hypothetical protein
LRVPISGKEPTFQLTRNRAITLLDGWPNGWWPGDPIDGDIFPPPDSTLTLNKPVDADAA